MRKKGSVCDFTLSRNEELKSCFFRLLSSPDFRFVKDTFAFLANSPASRFYVSESRAVEVILRHIRTGEWGIKPGPRRQMYMDIERLASVLMSLSPGMDFCDAVYEVVNSPAPSFYLTPDSCRVILYAALSERSGERSPKSVPGIFHSSSSVRA